MDSYPEHFSQFANCFDAPQYCFGLESNAGLSSSGCECCQNVDLAHFLNIPDRQCEKINEPLLPAMAHNERFDVKKKKLETNKNNGGRIGKLSNSQIAKMSNSRIGKHSNISNVKQAHNRTLNNSNVPRIKNPNSRNIKSTSINIDKYEKRRNTSIVVENENKGNSIKQPSMPSYKKRKKSTVLTPKSSRQNTNFKKNNTAKSRSDGVGRSERLNLVVKIASRTLSPTRQSPSIYSVDSARRMNQNKVKILNSSSKMMRRNTGLAGIVRPASDKIRASGIRVDSEMDSQPRYKGSAFHLKYLTSDLDDKSKLKSQTMGKITKFSSGKELDYTKGNLVNSKTKRAQLNIREPDTELKRSASDIDPKRGLPQKKKQGSVRGFKVSNKKDESWNRSRVSANSSEFKVKKKKSLTNGSKTKTFEKRSKDNRSITTSTSSSSESLADLRVSERMRRKKGKNKSEKSNSNAHIISGNSNSGHFDCGPYIIPSSQKTSECCMSCCGGSVAHQGCTGVPLDVPLAEIVKLKLKEGSSKSVTGLVFSKSEERQGYLIRIKFESNVTTQQVTQRDETSEEPVKHRYVEQFDPNEFYDPFAPTPTEDVSMQANIPKSIRPASGKKTDLESAMLNSKKSAKKIYVNKGTMTDYDPEFEKLFAKLTTVEENTKSHFRGDGCQLSDPLRRDREVRRLLGVRLQDQMDQSDKAYERKQFEKALSGISYHLSEDDMI